MMEQAGAMGLRNLWPSDHLCLSKLTPVPFRERTCGTVILKKPMPLRVGQEDAPGPGPVLQAAVWFQRRLPPAGESVWPGR